MTLGEPAFPGMREILRRYVETEFAGELYPLRDIDGNELDPGYTIVEYPPGRWEVSVRMSPLAQLINVAVITRGEHER